MQKKSQIPMVFTNLSWTIDIVIWQLKQNNFGIVFAPKFLHKTLLLAVLLSKSHLKIGIRNLVSGFFLEFLKRQNFQIHSSISNYLKK